MSDEDKGKFEFSNLFKKLDHPFLGAFATSWLLYNWDVVYLLILGREDFHATIQEIWTKYVSLSNDRMFLHPLYFTLAYLILGPFIGDFFKLFPTWSSMLIGKLKPVPQFKLDNLKASHIQMEDERNSFREAFGLTENSNNSQQNFQRLSSQNTNCQRQLEALRQELAKLKADYLLSKTGKLELILRAENQHMKERENILQYLSSKLRELNSAEMKYAIALLSKNGRFKHVTPA
jgi:hypothetical protein